MALEFKLAQPTELVLGLSENDRHFGVVATRDENFRTNSIMAGERYHLVAKENGEVLARGEIIGSLGDAVAAAQSMLADARAAGPPRPSANLSPLRGSIGVPSAPVVSMSAVNTRYRT
jgi:hypothetical protein